MDNGLIGFGAGTEMSDTPATPAPSSALTEGSDPGCSASITSPSFDVANLPLT